MREIPKEDIQGDPNIIFEDKRRLKGKLRKLVHRLHNEEKVIFARVKYPEKKLVFTILGAAAVLAGAVGIGAKVRSKGERKK